jgi:DNA-binding IclR family transcriptional regulator
MLDISKGAVHKHLKTLEALGYVVSDGNTYEVGLKFLGMSRAVRDRRAFYEHGRTEAMSLAKNTDAIAFLAVEERDQCLFIYSTSGDRHDPIGIKGRRLPMVETVAGRALLAHRESTEASGSDSAGIDLQDIRE